MSGPILDPGCAEPTCSAGFQPACRLEAGATTRVEVAAAVIERPDGTFLMARRPQGKAYAGWWEFPGGKVEAGESARHALDRELREELGIEVVEAWPWLKRAFVYPHAHVMLRFFRVTAWQGEPHPHEGQELAWCHTRMPEVEPILPANGPILKALRLPLEYAISDAEKLGVAAFLERLEQRLAGGLRLLQLREKFLAPAAFEDLARAVDARCRAQGAELMLNADAALATQLGCGLHLNSGQLMRLQARPEVALLGASCHGPEELARAAQLGVDFVVLSPVLPTPSHPGAETIGWERFNAWLADYPVPVYALGGLSLSGLAQARAAGAHGVALEKRRLETAVKALWAALPLLIIGLAAVVLWQGGDNTPAATLTLPCGDLATGCATRLHGREISFGTSGPVKPLKPFQIWVKAAGARKVQARFTMRGMDMGFNLYTLGADGDGVFRARVTLPVCVTGRRDWIMSVEIDGAVVNVPFSSDL